MPEPKFTPGPWFVTDDSCASPKGKSINAASFYVAETIGRLQDDVGLHDAHLIAAAPEMYTEIVSIRVLLENMHTSGSDWPFAVKVHLERTDALLAKARGESPP